MGEINQFVKPWHGIPREEINWSPTVVAERCIGCGLCVTTCPTHTLTLQRRAKAPPVPRNIVQAYIEAVQKRGKMTMIDLALLQLKSKLDRLLAAKP